MPTPSSNAPDPQSPRPHPFASCPDPDDPVPQAQQHTRTPQGWSYAGEEAMDAQESSSNTAGGREDSTSAAPSRSITMSPAPQSSSEGTAREAEQEPDGMLVGPNESEESRKLTDTDEEMVGAETGNRDRILESGVGTDGAAFGRRLAGSGGPEGSGPSRRTRKPVVTSPVSADGDKTDESGLIGSLDYEDSGVSGMGYEYSSMRVIPTTPSSYLRPGSRFHGTQQSERQVYDVQVEIKLVDLRESFLCGYLRIQGLTEDHPTLTTYFEGEIIGSRYGFITQHDDWGATDKIDLSHWAKFTAFRPFARQARKGGAVQIRDVAQRESIFMRWKEHFLVPDHRVRTINGASFEGFYYICFNQVKGEVSGIYFHSKSERFQQLELKHVEDRGCFGAMEFR